MVVSRRFELCVRLHMAILRMHAVASTLRCYRLATLAFGIGQRLYQEAEREWRRWDWQQKLKVSR